MKKTLKFLSVLWVLCLIINSIASLQIASAKTLGDFEYEINEDETTADETTSQEDTDTVKGDVSGDGIVDIIDLVLTRAHIVGNSQLNESQIKIADLNDDGEINVADLVIYRAMITPEVNYEFKSGEYKLTKKPQLEVKYELEKFYEFDDCDFYGYEYVDCDDVFLYDDGFDPCFDADYRGNVVISTKNFPDNVYGLQYTLSTDGFFETKKGYLPDGWAETYPKNMENTITVVCDCDFETTLQDQFILGINNQYEPVKVEDLKLVVLGDDGYLHLIDNITSEDFKITGDINTDEALDILDVALARAYIIGEIKPVSCITEDGETIILLVSTDVYNDMYKDVDFSDGNATGCIPETFIEPDDILKGDMNGDEVLDIIDVAMMRSAIVG